MTCGYQFDQDGWFAFVFDTRPGADPDGEWSMHIGENAVPMPHWHEPFDAWLEAHDEDAPAGPKDPAARTLEIVGYDGSRATFADPEADDMEAVAAPFGELFKAVLLAARDRDAFAALPLADGCLFGVEEHDGAWGWPTWDDRHTLGRVRPS